MAHILLIETDRILAGNIARIFKKRGHSIDWQVNPQEAIMSADRTQPDLVIMDLLLTVHSGVEFLYEFRSYEDWQDVPVIIFSNVPPDELDTSAAGFEQLDVNVYYHKPACTLAELATQTDRLLLPVSP